MPTVVSGAAEARGLATGCADKEVVLQVFEAAAQADHRAGQALPPGIHC
jgi:hypothetical protein